MARKKILNIPLALVTFLLAVTYLLRINYIEYWLEISIFTLIVFHALYSFRYIAKPNKNRKDSLKHALVFVWTIFHIAVYLRVENVNALQIALFVAGFAWFISELIDIANKKEDIINSPMFLGLLLMGLEGIMSISWWSFESITHILGLLLISIGFIVEFGRSRKLPGA
jgi:hypothetical protein